MQTNNLQRKFYYLLVLVNLRAKYRQEREENEKLRALLVGQAAKNKQAADALAPIVQEQPNVASLMKARVTIDS